ncbi:PepSY domain-containing protein [Lachnospiraceae bacterium 48-42]|jgi:Predicted membrane protein|nr:hypothetical protein [Lachnospiraceae bacterium]
MKQRIRMMISFCLIAALCLGSSMTSYAAKGQISRKKAKSIALKEAGVKEKNVKKWIKVKLDDYDYDDDQEWDVEFQTKSHKYEVEVDALTGYVKDFEKSQIKKRSSKAISEANAKKIALRAANVKAKNVKKWTKVRYDRKDNEWELKFRTSNYKFEIEINARSGRVNELEREKLLKDSSKYIGIKQAKSIALKHAKKHGDIKGEVYYTKAKLDKDDGVVCYKIEFNNNATEYEYEINAKTGRIMDWDIDEWEYDY